MIALLSFFSSLVLIAFVTLGLIVPLGAIFHAGGVSHFPIFDSDVLYAARLTAFQAGASAVLALILGTFLGVLVRKCSGKTLSLLRTLLALPFGVPAVVAASAWIALLGKSGFASNGILYTLCAVILAHVFFNAPWVALWVSHALDEISETKREASRSLGASPWQEFRHLVIPEILPTLISVFSQVFSFCAMSFILVLLLGGGPPVETLETALFIKVRSGGLDLSGATACAFWQLVLTFVPWLILNRLQKTSSSGLTSGGTLHSRPRASSTLVTISALLGALLFLAPYLILFRSSVLTHFFEMFGHPHSREAFLKGVKSSFELSIPTALLALVIALSGIWLDHELRAKKKASNFVANLMIFPSGISTMVLGLGLFIAYREWVDPFSNSLIPVVVLQSIFFVAVVFRVLRPISLRFQKSQFEAAQTLGAGLFQSFLVIEWKRWRVPVFAAFSLVLGAALGEVGAVSLFYNEERVPLPLLISRWASQYRFEDAESVALVLMILSLLIITLGVSNDRR